ncbi:fatty acid desaturase CarF family protein [Novosphingobium lentum]|uniref:fatty acid desaturase CarF family protein n=1 Tax=Novosphingobium lentum TaxID=145287 RepID=UPI00082D227D|nr:fatty acid desaturase CarF family protein [Novosphingobium lentum]
MKQRIILAIFLASLAANAVGVLADPGWLCLPAALLGWYVADLMSGLVHMYMDYRPCPPGKQLNDMFFYAGSRESAEYLALARDRLARINAFERLVYDFKNHHPRPDALGRRSLWRLIGSTVIVATLPLSLLLLAAQLVWSVPGWVVAGVLALLTGGAFAQFFHGSLHRAHNPWIVEMLRGARLLMTPAAHQLHHDTLQRDFATNCGWSNPLINRLFAALRARGYLGDAGLEPSS